MSVGIFYTCIHIQMSIIWHNIYVHKCTSVYTYVYLCLYICNTYVHLYMRVYIYIYICLYVWYVTCSISYSSCKIEQVAPNILQIKPVACSLNY